MRLMALATGLALVMPASATQPARPVAVAAQAATTPAPAGTYAADPAHTSVTWRIRHFGLSNYTARFARADARLEWNPDRPEASRLSVTIDPASVRTDFPNPEVEDFDARIATSADFLAGQPITFVSTDVKPYGKRRAIVTGDLTMRGTTRPATLDVVFNGSMASHPMDKTSKLGFSATSTIKRSRWGLDFALGALSDEVTLVVETELAPAH